MKLTYAHARAHAPRPQIPAAPLASLALLALASVLIAGMYSASRGPAMRFAGPAGLGGFDDRGAVRVEVDSARHVAVDGVAVAFESLSPAVADRLSGRVGVGVILDVSPDASYQVMIDAFAAIASLPGPPPIAFPNRSTRMVE